MTYDERLLEINEMIATGWGDVPGFKIPANWRDMPGPAITGPKVRVEIDRHVLFLDPLIVEGLPSPRCDVYSGSTMDLDAACTLRNELERVVRARLTPKSPKGRPKGSRNANPRKTADVRDRRLAAFRERQKTIGVRSTFGRPRARRAPV